MSPLITKTNINQNEEQAEAIINKETFQKIVK